MKVVEEIWTCNEVDYSSLRVFGCPAYVHIPSEEQSKLDLMCLSQICERS
jgi:hypothetical protein